MDFCEASPKSLNPPIHQDPRHVVRSAAATALGEMGKVAQDSGEMQFGREG